MGRVLNRPKMLADLQAFREAGGIIHVTVKGGCCIHDPPDLRHFHSYTPGFSGPDDDWYLDTVRELWPGGLPVCPTAQPGVPDA